MLENKYYDMLKASIERNGNLDPKSIQLTVALARDNEELPQLKQAIKDAKDLHPRMKTATNIALMLFGLSSLMSESNQASNLSDEVSV